MVLFHTVFFFLKKLIGYVCPSQESCLSFLFDFLLFSQWPVGLKNVGQTCWFSAVIQSLFYLPAFRTLVFEYEPPSDAQRKEEAVLAANTYDVERQRKIVEFMMELRRSVDISA